MGRKTPPHKNNPAITEAKFRSIIMSALRNASRWWKPASIAKEKACVGIRVNKKTGKRAKHYKCEKCKKLFISKEIDADHINAVIPMTGFTSWDDVINRLFAQVSAYQALCKECHKEKTNQERKLRKQIKDESKR